MENPFSSRFVRPQSARLLATNSHCVEDLLSRWRSSDLRGAIVGPHGSGKTTLLRAAARELATRGYESLWVEITSERDAVRQQIFARPSIHGKNAVLVDGYDQLHWAIKHRLRWLIRRSGLGILVTTHGNSPFSVVASTQMTQQLAMSCIAERAGWAFVESYRSEIARSFAIHHGNLREVYWDMYDIFERYEHAERIDTADSASPLYSNDAENEHRRIA